MYRNNDEDMVVLRHVLGFIITWPRGIERHVLPFLAGRERDWRDVTMLRDNDANQRRKGMIKQTITLALNLIPDCNWHLISWQFPAPFVTVSPLPRL